jgi:hypothetical protein
MADRAAGRLALRAYRQMSRTAAGPFPLLLCALLLAAASPCALAQELPNEKGVARTVKMFDMYCLTQLPDIEGIERFAGIGEFAQILGADLAPYASGMPEEKLLGWRFHDFGAELILIAARAKPDEAFHQKHPAFAKAKTVSCSLLIPNHASRDEVVAALTQRLGQAPDESLDDAGVKVWAWNKETAKAVSRVIYSVPAEKGRKATLSATLILAD